MTDDDKALVERLRADWPEILVEKHWMMDSDAIEEQRKEAADRIEAQAAEIERVNHANQELQSENARLREALNQIAAPAYVSVGTHKHMHLAWREIACRRIDIARDVLGETE